MYLSHRYLELEYANQSRCFIHVFGYILETEISLQKFEIIQINTVGWDEWDAAHWEATELSIQMRSIKKAKGSPSDVLLRIGQITSILSL